MEPIITMLLLEKANPIPKFTKITASDIFYEKHLSK